LPIFFGITFSILTELSRWLIDSHRSSYQLNSSLIVYIICSFILRLSLSGFIFFYLGESLIQLYSRLYQSKIFEALSYRNLSIKSNLPHIKLDTLESIQGWQILRSCLLYEYQQPKIYIDVVLSSGFVIWLPLIIISGTHFLFKLPMSMFLLLCLILSVFIFIYLIICISLAGTTRQKFNHLGLLHLEEYRLLCYPKSSSDIVHPKQTEINLLVKIRQIIQFGKNEAIVFRILGWGINQNATTVMIGLIISAITSILAKLIS
jgi:hypothetical protein